MRYTIKDVAKEADVSVTTVSKIINNNDSDISAKTIERVKRIIEQKGYVPNNAARSMVTKKSKMVGLILPDISNNYFAKIAREVETVFKGLGYSVILCNSDDDYDIEIEYFYLLLKKGVDGVIVVPSVRSSEEGFKSVKYEKKPMVFLDRVFNFQETEAALGNVYFNNVEGGYQACKYLLDNGHRKIACITGPLQQKSAADRLEGYKKALTEYGVEIRDEWIFEGNYRFDSGQSFANQIFNEDVTAVFAQNDLMATGIYSVAIESGIQIGKDLSVIGYDDSDYCEILSPKLTSVSQASMEMCDAAVHMLKDLMEGVPCNKLREFLPSIKIRNSIYKCEY